MFITTHDEHKMNTVPIYCPVIRFIKLGGFLISDVTDMVKKKLL